MTTLNLPSHRGWKTERLSLQTYSNFTDQDPVSRNTVPAPNIGLSLRDAWCVYICIYEWRPKKKNKKMHLGMVWLNSSPASPASPAPLSTSPDGDVCKYYIGPSVACLSVLSSAAAVATQWHADRGRRVYDCPTAACSRQVSGHVVLLDAQSACLSADRWSHSHATEALLYN